jgi:hypothetical protein
LSLRYCGTDESIARHLKSILLLHMVLCSHFKFLYICFLGVFFWIAHVYTRVKIIGWSGHTIQNYSSFVIYVIFVCVREWSGSKATIWIHVAVNYIGSFFPLLERWAPVRCSTSITFGAKSRRGALTVGEGSEKKIYCDNYCWKVKV